MSLPRPRLPSSCSHTLPAAERTGFQVGKGCLLYADTEQAAHVFFATSCGWAWLGCYELSSELTSWGRKPSLPSPSWPEAPRTARLLQQEA